ncbi:hypothetical protein C1645_881372 [Glomus cerebriforme]|uniref:Sel1 repeat family protein n=1 Tax=Glomus cerebriforme TaxID=658196 RepID=A0A397S635_9GLOM|nr:hypothetical protein C1645_881372 [Glomus cerebriforme]
MTSNSQKYFCYSSLIGCEINDAKAFAEGGNKHALSKLGDLYCYEIGVFGVLKDESKAFKGYSKAAEKGYASSQFDVANFYYDGIYVPKDEEKGFY